MPEADGTVAPVIDTDAYFALARKALLEITREDTLGEPLEVVDEGEGVATVRFANTLPGYPDWKWTVSIASVDGSEPTVLETELLPGDGSLLAPDWVPWAERLAEYEASQEAAHASGAGDDSDDDESDDDDDSDDDSDDDDFDDEDDDSDDESDGDEGDDLEPREEFDGIDVEEAAEAAGLDGSGDDDESDVDDESDDEDPDDRQDPARD